MSVSKGNQTLIHTQPPDIPKTAKVLLDGSKELPAKNPFVKKMSSKKQLPLDSNILAQEQHPLELLLMESRALVGALQVIETGGPLKSEVLKQCRSYLEYHPVNDLDGVVADCSLRSICSKPSVDYEFEVKGVTWEAQLLTAVMRAWVYWRHGNVERAAHTLGELRRNSDDDLGSNLNVMALERVRVAVASLIKEEDAKPLFQRAIQISSEYGTTSHHTIQWIYAGTFFP